MTSVQDVGTLLAVSLIVLALSGCGPTARAKPKATTTKAVPAVESPDAGEQTEILQTSPPEAPVTLSGGQTSAESNDRTAVVVEDQQPPNKKADVPATDDETRVISFDHLNIGMQVDVKFRPQMLEFEGGEVKELFGKRINVAGYISPTDTMKGVSEFILLKNLECKFGPGGQADHLVHVVMEDGLTTDFTDKPVYVEGILTLNPYPVDEPITWSIYDLKATKVSTRPPRRGR